MQEFKKPVIKIETNKDALEPADLIKQVSYQHEQNVKFLKEFTPPEPVSSFRPRIDSFGPEGTFPNLASPNDINPKKNFDSREITPFHTYENSLIISPFNFDSDIFSNNKN